MPAIVRKGDISTGHPPFPPRPNDAGSSNVFVNGVPIHRVGDHWLIHCAGPSCHDGNMAVGSPTVYANSKKVARVGDLISCSDHTAVGSPNVFAN